MKHLIRQTQKFRTIARVLNNYPEAFVGRTEALAAKETFISKSNELAMLLRIFVTPLTIVYQPRLNSKSELLKGLRSMIYMGIMLAKRKNDKVLLVTFTEFSKQLSSISATDMIGIAHHVIGILHDNEAFAADLGLTAESIQTFETQLLDFETAQMSTQDIMDDRRKGREDVFRLIKECNQMLRLELDRYIHFNAAQYPRLSSAYNNIRRVRRKKKQNAVPTDSDVSGTITDLISGLPVAGAVIQFMEFSDEIETDADGYFIYDELEPGDYSLSCHAKGYEVPEPIVFTLRANESVVLDFKLTPSTADGK